MIKKINGDLCHEILSKNYHRNLGFTKGCDYDIWCESVREKFTQLLGINKIKENSCPLNLEIEEVTEKKTFVQLRFTFESEIGAIIPCYLLIPKGENKKYPVAIELQGHISGFHNSIGVAKYDNDIEKYFPRYNMGLQAVENGFAALCIEMRGMGETASKRTYGDEVYFQPCRQTCAYTALTAFSLGRTLIGERVWDVKRAIDALETLTCYPLDLSKIMVLGHSGGATAAYYAATFDKRIGYCAPSCGFCSHRSSILDIEHCACNYIPGMSDWLEMEDVSCLIAPRNLTVFAGSKDSIFPIDGVRDAFDTVRKIYSAEGAEDKCRLVETPMHHWFCHELVWENIVKDTNEMGW